MYWSTNLQICEPSGHSGSSGRAWTFELSGGWNCSIVVHDKSNGCGSNGGSYKKPSKHLVLHVQPHYIIDCIWGN